VRVRGRVRVRAHLLHEAELGRLSEHDAHDLLAVHTVVRVGGLDLRGESRLLLGSY
jgi:hypothetical protein